MSPREELRANVGPRYRGELHLAFTLTASLGVTAALLAQLRGVRAVELLVVPGFFVLCCLLEYLEHRYLLHRRQRYADFAFRIHTLEHHRFFTDVEYAPEGRRDWAFVLFPPGLVAGYLLFVVPLFAVPARLLLGANAGWLVGATAAFFFFLYEAIHFGSHLGLLGAHHRLHHRAELMTACNFNVVCPIFDWVLGTRVRG